jgi:hypothetical protein
MALSATAGLVGGVSLAHHTPTRTSTTTASSSAYARQSRAALVRYLSHGYRPVAMLRPAPAAHLAGTTKESSTNWSGYADSSTTNGTFTQVAGAWAVPKVTCTAEDTLAVDWVGIDGLTNGTVEQDGTLDWCFQDKATYYTWWEMYPASSVDVGTSVVPGDKITASVSRSGTAYTLAVTDATHTANSFSRTGSCAAATCVDTSVEWIAERPAFSIGVVPQAKFGTWVLSGATETAAGKVGTISSYKTNDAITMIDATETYDLTTVSALTTANKFTATWHNSY